MDARKITVVATILVIALAAVGIGFAYTAMTQNTDNNVDVEYLKMKSMTDSGEDMVDKYSASFNKNFALSTSTASSSNVTYWIADEITVVEIDDVKYFEAGYVYLIIDQQQSLKPYTLYMKDTDGTINTTDYLYKVILSVGTLETLTDFDAATAAAAVTPQSPVDYVPGTGISYLVTGDAKSEEYSIIKVALYAALNNGGTPANEITKAWDAPVSAAVLDDVDFTFTAVAESIVITLGENMNLAAAPNGSLTQKTGGAITTVKIEADDGYEFANNYMGAQLVVDKYQKVINGLTITIAGDNSYITITGTPTNPGYLPLAEATEES